MSQGKAFDLDCGGLDSNPPSSMNLMSSFGKAAISQPQFLVSEMEQKAAFGDDLKIT